MLKKEILEVLVCPKCKGKVTTKDENKKELIKYIDLEYDEKDQKIICQHCRLKYSIDDNIPIMLIEEAETF